MNIIRLIIAPLVLAGSLAHAEVGLVQSAHPQPLLVASQETMERPTPPRAQAALPDKPPQPTAPIVTVSTTAAGQAGYVHYFVITGPDGEAESQIGIELPGDRIAWSFPGLGVNVSDFIASGRIHAQGKAYEVRHLYGMRPFRDAPSMRTLQQELAARVAPWLADNTPYCDEERPPNQVCASCLGFVLRVLYPSPTGGLAAVPALPADFKSARKNVYTTEDFLLYLAGVRIDVPKQARTAEIETLAVPEALRAELLRISDETGEAIPPPAAVAATKPINGKARPAGRATVDLPKRVLTRRRS